MEVQGTAEKDAFTRAQFDTLLTLAEAGVRDLVAAQKRALGQA